jgi:hypothetical protein
MGLYSPPQTPDGRIEKSNQVRLICPETPPPSTHRVDLPESPETPTHPTFNSTGDATLFEDNARVQPPLTPVLYNLIRNEGTTPRFIPAVAPKEGDVPGPAIFTLWLMVESSDDEFGDKTLRGHPSACLFVARYSHPNSLLTLFLVLIPLKRKTISAKV